MDSMKNILSAHNNKILNDAVNNDNKKMCNCRDKKSCPLEGKCLTEKVVYSAEVTSANEENTKLYIGISETPFKTRFRNHKKSMNHRKYQKDTELSKLVWELKDAGTDFTIKWSIMRKSSSGYNSVTKSCNLCLLEKL